MLRAKKHPSGELVKTWSVCRAREKKELLYTQRKMSILRVVPAALSWAAYGDR